MNKELFERTSKKAYDGVDQEELRAFVRDALKSSLDSEWSSENATSGELTEDLPISAKKRYILINTIANFLDLSKAINDGMRKSALIDREVYDKNSEFLYDIVDKAADSMFYLAALIHILGIYPEEFDRLLTMKIASHLVKETNEGKRGRYEILMDNSKTIGETYTRLRME